MFKCIAMLCVLDVLLYYVIKYDKFCYRDITWPLRSLDFNLCDFFLWGFMYELVYAKEVNNIDELLMRMNNVADIIC